MAFGVSVALNAIFTASGPPIAGTFFLMKFVKHAAVYSLSYEHLMQHCAAPCRDLARFDWFKVYCQLSCHVLLFQRQRNSFLY